MFATCPEDTLELENAYRWAIRIIKGMEQLPSKASNRKAQLLALANGRLREGISKADKAVVFTNKVTAQLVLNHFILEVESSHQKTHLAQRFVLSHHHHPILAAALHDGGGRENLTLVIPEHCFRYTHTHTTITTSRKS